MWEETEEKLDEFHKLLNSLNPKIQFTMERDVTFFGHFTLQEQKQAGM